MSGDSPDAGEADAREADAREADAREPAARELDVTVTALAAGGDGVARDEAGRVTFVPRTAPGDRVRGRIVKHTASFARAELVSVLEPSPVRVAPPCEAFERRCGGCQWQHVARAAQLDAKQAIATGALRALDVAIERIADPCAPLGWRRRARFHVVGGKLGLYAYASTELVPLRHCPQLEPELDAAVALIAGRTPPDGELAVLRGLGGIVVATERAWKAAGALVGKAGIVGVVAGKETHGEAVIEVEPGLFGGARDFQQASAAGNAALIELVRAALGRGPGELLELHAGAGNLTRAFVADGWTTVASDVARPARAIVPTAPPVGGAGGPAQVPAGGSATFRVGAADRVLAATAKADAIVLDPPRTGAPEAIAGIAKLAPRVVVYVSCDPATLARDAARLVAAGYRAERAWPIDLMPQTSHVEVVLRLVR